MTAARSRHADDSSSPSALPSASAITGADSRTWRPNADVVDIAESPAIAAVTGITCSPSEPETVTSIRAAPRPRPASRSEIRSASVAIAAPPP
ncbi:MAG: hypothetical protein IPQ07_33075 [Myxococcales bacterium]|nr:hypothetical protein [Myxococcales bacterium]